MNFNQNSLSEVYSNTKKIVIIAKKLLMITLIFYVCEKSFIVNAKENLDKEISKEDEYGGRRTFDREAEEQRGRDSHCSNLYNQYNDVKKEFNAACAGYGAGANCENTVSACLDSKSDFHDNLRQAMTSYTTGMPMDSILTNAASSLVLGGSGRSQSSCPSSTDLDYKDFKKNINSDIDDAKKEVDDLKEKLLDKQSDIKDKIAEKKSNFNDTLAEKEQKILEDERATQEATREANQNIQKAKLDIRIKKAQIRTAGSEVAKMQEQQARAIEIATQALDLEKYRCWDAVNEFNQKSKNPKNFGMAASLMRNFSQERAKLVKAYKACFAKAVGDRLNKIDEFNLEVEKRKTQIEGWRDEIKDLEQNVAALEKDIKDNQQNQAQKTAATRKDLLTKSQQLVQEATQLNETASQYATSIGQSIQESQAKITRSYNDLMAYGPAPAPGATNTYKDALSKYEIMKSISDQYCNSPCNKVALYKMSSCSREGKRNPATDSFKTKSSEGRQY